LVTHWRYKIGYGFSSAVPIVFSVCRKSENCNFADVKETVNFLKWQFTSNFKAFSEEASCCYMGMFCCYRRKLFADSGGGEDKEVVAFLTFFRINALLKFRKFSEMLEFSYSQCPGSCNPARGIW